jgi:glycosyltransferase involved in cell wall biosynthesis
MDLDISEKLPLVSVCTPTFNRRPFIEHMIKCFNNQTYPKNRLEWIIVDDGTDKIADLVSDHPNVTYYPLDEKLPLGKKRNFMHTKVSGDIIVYMDDDDYYPPERISHAVETLMNNPTAMCAGSSEIYIYFKHIDKVIQFGPYGDSHATAGTFAFRKGLLRDHAYDDHASLAEEKSFLKNYTVSFVQLDPIKTILVFSHEHNTFDKRKLLESPNPNFVKVSEKTVDTFVKESDMKQFYMNDVELLLKDYEPGRPCMKPDVLENMIKIEEERRKEAEAMARNMASQGNIMIQQQGQPPKVMKAEDIVKLLKHQQETIMKLQHILRIKDEEIILLGSELLKLRSVTHTQSSVASNDNSEPLNNDDLMQSYLSQINQ